MPTYRESAISGCIEILALLNKKKSDIEAKYKDELQQIDCDIAAIERTLELAGITNVTEASPPPPLG